jgi:cellulose synthase/poly-beta-1,6-N-acetylglucosamine synthase-like glycosyltransferase
MTLTKKGYDFMVTNEYSSFVTFSRMKTLGLDVLRGADQKPFGGQVEYDVWLTIDSDIVFTPEQVVELLEDTKKYPVVSGLYRMQDMKHMACVKEWDTNYFKKNGSFEFMKANELEREDKYISVAYNGMGFFACRREVLEKMKYPYFSHPLIEFDGLKDMCSEDVAFCKNLKDTGFDVTVNTTLRVGHEKTLVI